MREESRLEEYRLSKAEASGEEKDGGEEQDGGMPVVTKGFSL